MQDIISQQLAGGSVSVDSTKQIIATAGSFLNAIDCSKSANCSAINRTPCKEVANTCGPCMSAEFTSGQDGASNTPCIRAADLKTR